MIWLEVLVEGASDEPAVREVLIRKFNLSEGEHFRIHPHRGKGRLPQNPLSLPNIKHQGLLDQLPAKLRGFGRSLPDHAVVLVVVDVDDTSCRDLLKELNSMLDALPNKPKVLFRLAIEETESWFLADIEALQKAYPTQLKRPILKGISPDAVVGAWETLARALGLEPKSVGPGVKTDWAKKISPHLNLDTPRSPSFKKLIDGIDKLVQEGRT
ncbi:MAG: DUF4276 family protein [Bdellovibrionales bacterium]|nr:DUF4276 family protein [Ramlibacter sp.]